MGGGAIPTEMNTPANEAADKASSNDASTSARINRWMRISKPFLMELCRSGRFQSVRLSLETRSTTLSCVLRDVTARIYFQEDEQLLICPKVQEGQRES